MKYIVEQFNTPSIEFLTEGNGQDKKFFIEGIFMQAETKNRNGRIYKKNVLENAVDVFIENRVNKNRAIGELNHPMTPMVDPKNASHLIKELHWEGNDVIGRAQILSTPNIHARIISTNFFKIISVN